MGTDNFSVLIYVPLWFCLSLNHSFAKTLMLLSFVVQPNLLTTNYNFGKISGNN